jgi:hypothetical protein
VNKLNRDSSFVISLKRAHKIHIDEGASGSPKRKLGERVVVEALGDFQEILQGEGANS